MNYKLIDNGNTIKAGQLVPVTTPHGHTLDESKEYFNGSPEYEKPVVLFQEKGETISLNLNRSKNGFHSGQVIRGMKYGCNFNRVQNKRARWGLTVWRETTQKANG